MNQELEDFENLPAEAKTAYERWVEAETGENGLDISSPSQQCIKMFRFQQSILRKVSFFQTGTTLWQSILQTQGDQVWSINRLPGY